MYDHDKIFGSLKLLAQNTFKNFTSANLSKLYKNLAMVQQCDHSGV